MEDKARYRKQQQKRDENPQKMKKHKTDMKEKGASGPPVERSEMSVDIRSAHGGKRQAGGPPVVRSEMSMDIHSAQSVNK